MATWRKWLAIGLGVTLGVPALLCAGTGLAGLAVDGDVNLEAEEHLDVPPERLYDLLDDADGIARWWGRMMEKSAPEGAPAMTIAAQPGAPAAGVGAKVDFVAAGMTAETWTILALEAPGKVVYDIDFKIMRVERTITLMPETGGTRVRWTEKGTIGNPWIRLMSMGGHEDVVANFHLAIQAMGEAAGS